MSKRVVAACVGGLTLAILFVGTGLLLGWIELGGAIPVAMAGAAVGAVIGWLRPGVIFKTILFFLDVATQD